MTAGLCDDRDASAKWFALRVRSNYEQITALGLAGKGYETFVPTYPAFVGRRRQTAEKVLFPGYIFSRFPAARRLPVLMSPGLLHIVGIGKTPHPVEDYEIDSVRKLVKAKLEFDPNEAFAAGQLVEIVQGPLQGAYGVVLGLNDRRRLCLSITLLRRTVSVEIAPEWLATVKQPETVS